MPNTINVQNNFTGGLKTEFTGLNFPENAATDTDNCIYTLIGDVLRREGVDYEINANQIVIDRTNRAVATYKWNNVSGDGTLQILVVQIGETLHFFQTSNATVNNPISSTKLTSTVGMSVYDISNFAFDQRSVESQFADGNGYLFVFHPGREPIYCEYIAGTITPHLITVQIRDLDGANYDGANADETGLYGNLRPVGLSNGHAYNLINQGWFSAPNIVAFQVANGVYPSNSDVWWRFKDATGVFNPTPTIVSNGTLGGPAPKGSIILAAFQQVRNQTGVALPQILATARPKTGTWFQGRVWYAGADAPAIVRYTFSENIYFSQIITSPDQFGFCFQVNDPTSAALFDILPTDGGVIKIQGCGTIYKLFPIQNGLLVFAANGIWFITGSQGIGFSATDYTITKISAIQSISSIPFISVLGYPIFWNEEGIYSVTPDPKGSGLTVDNLCIGTILSYYASIPLQSKKFARGDYNPLDFTIQWTFRSTNESSINDRYVYDKILNFNTSNKAFYPFSFTGEPTINGVIYIAGPGGSTSPTPVFKYLTSIFSSSVNSYRFSFAEERDATHFVDWFSRDGVGINYTSYFETGFRIAGKALTKWQPVYIYMFLRGSSNSYKIQGIWDFAGSGNSGRFSTIQIITDVSARYDMLFRRHKIRGHGLVLQLKVKSVDGQPFDIMGWSSLEQTNQGT